MASEPVDRDTEQVRVLSVFQYAAAFVAAVMGSFPLVHVALGLLFVLLPDSARGSGDEAIPREMGFFFLGIGLLGVLVGWLIAATHFFTAQFLRRRRGYWFCVIASGITCLACTCSSGMVGIASLVILLRPGVKDVFDRESRVAEPVRVAQTDARREAHVHSGQQEASTTPPKAADPGGGPSDV